MNTNNLEPSHNNVQSNDLSIIQLNSMIGIKWLRDSFQLFAKSPGSWLIIFMLYLVINVGFIMSSILVLLPVISAGAFSAGFIYSAKMLDQNQRLNIEYLFTAFKTQLRSFFRLGMLYLIILFILGISFSAVLSNFIDEKQILLMGKMSQQELQALLESSPEYLTVILKAMMLSSIFSAPILMMTWHAPALILFHQLTPIEAMVLSFKCCFKNIQAYALFGLMITILFIFILSLPVGLTIFILPIALVILNVSQYCSYKSSFKSNSSDKSNNVEQGTFIV